MCKELQAELDRGGDLARQLVEHLLTMGAARCTIPVEIDGQRYQVRVGVAEDAYEQLNLTPEQFQREYMGTFR
uniref:Uncharacterized protein n=1 Tax=viral metagenome TaxID=1070528 RepID=A0A6H1ZJ29_9ZZZZ